jgi:hypothetical protein
MKRIAKESTQQMKRIAVAMATTVALWLAGCAGPSPEERAMELVQHSYDCLLEGNYDGFLKGRADMDSIPESYREQLLTAYKQYIHQQRLDHEDIVSFQTTRALTDTAQHQMQVFLLVNYADSTTEEIVVPMVETGSGEWKMK